MTPNTQPSMAMGKVAAMNNAPLPMPPLNIPPSGPSPAPPMPMPPSAAPAMPAAPQGMPAGPTTAGIPLPGALAPAGPIAPPWKVKQQPDGSSVNYIPSPDGDASKDIIIGVNQAPKMPKGLGAPMPQH